MPELFIITGSNGAGKSSIGPEYLPARIRQQGPIFDGDKLLPKKSGLGSRSFAKIVSEVTGNQRNTGSRIEISVQFIEQYFIIC
jgi:predicted ABC-type ATPase